MKWRPNLTEPAPLKRTPRMAMHDKAAVEQHLNHAQYHLEKALEAGMWSIPERNWIKDDLRRLSNYMRINKNKPVAR